MQEKLRAVACQQNKKSQTEKIINAFDAGDVDLARRILLASYRHHTRPTLNVTERLELMWCLAWFAFYEGCMEKGEILVRQIISLEESLIERRQDKIIHAKFVLSIFCSNLGKTASADQCTKEVESMLRAANFQSSNKALIMSELNSASRFGAVLRFQTVENSAHHLCANGTSHQPLFAVS